MDVPDPAICWLVSNSSSNGELACLSNVCRKWREVVTTTIIGSVKESLHSSEADNESEKSNNILLLPSMARYVMAQGTSSPARNSHVETYCLAWFHPMGIQFRRIPVDIMDDSDNEDQAMMEKSRYGNESPQPFAPGGEQSYAGSEDELKFSRRQLTRNVTPTVASINARLRRLEENDKYVNCLYQWNGYREPFEVLRPFGYTTSFVNEVLTHAQNCWVKGSISSSISVPSSPSKQSQDMFRTFSVRGATIARPEGYCLCWDSDIALPDFNSNDFNDDARSALQQQERDQLLLRRKRRRRELQRELLPKVLNSALENVSNRKEKNSAGIHLPCVQFLNVDSSHAVRLFTPPFVSPVRTPITVFCVGIATEDGCFMSGLRRRFELGHLYPETPRDDLIERSPICLCADAGNQDWMSDDPAEGLGNDSEKDNSYNSDDSSCFMGLDNAGNDPRLKCDCPFSGLGDVTEGDEEEFNSQICRGRLGPGAWHCYVAVFDGVESSIRIDGIAEPARCSLPASLEEAFLDGLTIGADHSFDMSLCFGQGSDGEGEGAIAELAVFKGCLDITDVMVMENHLMTKFGIPQPVLLERELLEEHQFARLAHAMLSHPPRHRLFASGDQRVPLKYMTKHRVVAWRQTNPVTGEPVRVARIGTKSAESSSEW